MKNPWDVPALEMGCAWEVVAERLKPTREPQLPDDQFLTNQHTGSPLPDHRTDRHTDHHTEAGPTAGRQPVLDSDVDACRA